jgi:hypothetical protein
MVDILQTTTTTTPTKSSTTTTTATTPTSTTTTSTTSTTPTSSTTAFVPTIPETILIDVNAIVPIVAALVASYRLLIGGAEEIQRTPGMPDLVFRRAVDRVDLSGLLIDRLLELLACKIPFSADILGVSCAPLDLFRLLGEQETSLLDNRQLAEQLAAAEALRRIFAKKSAQRPIGSETPPLTPPSAPTPDTAPSTDTAAISISETIVEFDQRADTESKQATASAKVAAESLATRSPLHWSWPKKKP